MTNELKCPVCGEGMKIMPDGFCICRIDNCYLHDFIHEEDVKTINESIQSRIDKAVIAERER